MVGSSPQDIRAEIRFATTTPDETIGRTIEFFEGQAKKFHLIAIGIGAFGPVDLDPPRRKVLVVALGVDVLGIKPQPLADFQVAEQHMAPRQPAGHRDDHVRP